ncbi:hypothetical protein [Sulfitobacter sp. SK012]|uniref:hypothetical protein n=1 Tax=Sulfitobacter sp. SK012 TaxID=1389005 RepID=UPI0013B43E37|nr:hypothetical protein [Sulfitobacter sp. SK012]
MSLITPGGTVSILNESGKWDQVTFPKFSIFVGVDVDLNPLHARLALVGGMPRSDVLFDSGLGHTYHSSDGFNTFPD